MPSRRNFLRQLTVVGTAMLLPLTAAHAAPAGTLAPLGPVSHFPTNQVVKVTLPGGKVAYVRRLPGKEPKYLALNAACTHRGCPVNWEASSKQFVCPCHGGVYNAQGVNISGPPPSPLATLKTQVKAGTLYAEV